MWATVEVTLRAPGAPMSTWVRGRVTLVSRASSRPRPLLLPNLVSGSSRTGESPRHRPGVSRVGAGARALVQGSSSVVVDPSSFNQAR